MLYTLKLNKLITGSLYATDKLSSHNRTYPEISEILSDIGSSLENLLNGYTLSDFAIMVAVISFLGFVLENTWLLFTKGYIDNRNMTLPFLLGYGLLVVGLALLVGTPQTLTIRGRELYAESPVKAFFAYFAISFILVSVGEILLGMTVERVFGFEYWNYTRIPLHITKYTSIPTSTGFALIITGFMGSCFSPLMSLITKIPESPKETAGFLLMTVMVTDFIVSFAKMYRTHTFNIRWQAEHHAIHSSDR